MIYFNDHEPSFIQPYRGKVYAESTVFKLLHNIDVFLRDACKSDDQKFSFLQLKYFFSARAGGSDVFVRDVLHGLMYEVDYHVYHAKKVEDELKKIGKRYNPISKKIVDIE